MDTTTIMSGMMACVAITYMYVKYLEPKCNDQSERTTEAIRASGEALNTLRAEIKADRDKVWKPRVEVNTARIESAVSCSECTQYTPRHAANEYEKACKEWLKGCSNATADDPTLCKDCTASFLAHVMSMTTCKETKQKCKGRVS